MRSFSISCANTRSRRLAGKPSRRLCFFGPGFEHGWVGPGFRAVGPGSWSARLFSLALALLLAALTAVPAEAKKEKKPRYPEELFNPLLGIEYSHWLVGPISRMASDQEIAEYLDLIDDGEAAAFIEAFWQERNEGTGFFEETPQQKFEKLAVEADKRFSEGARPGRLTDRGTIYILYGEPEEVEHTRPDRIDDPTLEQWTYPKDAPPGLDDESPKSTYRFVRVGDSTVFYNTASARRREIENRRKPNPPRIRQLDRSPRF